MSRKRKSPDSDPPLSRDGTNGLLTPRDSTHLSREPSVVSISSSSDIGDVTSQSPEVYNGLLQKKEGRILAKKASALQVFTRSRTNFSQSRDASVIKVNATNLPTPQMLQAAAASPFTSAQRLIREAFWRKLKDVPKVRLENKIDASTPSLDFIFIPECVLRDGVYRADLQTSEGCQKPCRPNMGQNIGCEYTKQCTCLEYAAVDEEALRKRDPDVYQTYKAQKDANDFIETAGLPKRFPYTKPNLDARVPSTLRSFYRDTRHPIYECNQNCNCGPGCKSRVAQKGRRVPLTIFKTPNRGWGVLCDEDLIRGEFIDTYLGEVITNEETDRRESIGGKDKASYLYSLDKFVGDDDELTEETCFVVDGQYMGGPSRFINHCCEPNCRQYTVSYNKHDLRLYDIAFFAYEDIKKGTELTFDYLDKDEEEEEDVVRKREEAAKDPENLDKKPCNCGAVKCRGYLWV
ncbi:hypothetical protein LTR36_005298 [Oleoguttula mirabilis]|uniref:SET domain-containing protein n=1 Tax=Oleoguttula mirabilis TaxID=1507867 RepID=A0AAV9JFM4_9PEZI|nr:hypothetical protein LTR36_005298 [Oleoguttula mirabilis]